VAYVEASPNSFFACMSSLAVKWEESITRITFS
jgi:hypothetical protein